MPFSKKNDSISTPRNSERRGKMKDGTWDKLYKETSLAVTAAGQQNVFWKRTMKEDSGTEDYRENDGCSIHDVYPVAVVGFVLQAYGSTLFSQG